MLIVGFLMRQFNYIKTMVHVYMTQNILAAHKLLFHGPPFNPKSIHTFHVKISQSTFVTCLIIENNIFRETCQIYNKIRFCKHVVSKVIWFCVTLNKQLKRDNESTINTTVTVYLDASKDRRVHEVRVHVARER